MRIVQPPAPHRFLDLLLPAAGPVARGRAAMVITMALALSICIWAIILFWFATGDLESMTVLLGLVLSLLLIGTAALARIGHTLRAAWCLVLLLLVLVVLNTASYGLGTGAESGYAVPLVLVACTLGLHPTLLVTSISIVSVWVIAAAGAAGWYEPLEPFASWHLTFSAPFLTILFILVAVPAALWSDHLRNHLEKE
ncbi:MAG: hypothetical protein JXA93_21050 [Anaerolineae bacterium]|nr:hypothetical protein [Anaerolineae bacterium]